MLTFGWEKYYDSGSTTIDNKNLSFKNSQLLECVFMMSLFWLIKNREGFWFLMEWMNTIMFKTNSNKPLFIQTRKKIKSSFIRFTVIYIVFVNIGRKFDSIIESAPCCFPDGTDIYRNIPTLKERILRRILYLDQIEGTRLLKI